MKFGRSYYMSVTGLDGVDIVASLPLTMEFTSQHTQNAEANVGNFSIYNLSKNDRSALVINSWSKGSGPENAQFFPITVRAGYISETGGLKGSPQSLPIVFDGYIREAFTEKSGSDIITRINALDNGELCTGQGSAVFPESFRIPSNTPFVQMVRMVMGQMGILVHTGKIIINPVPPSVGPRGRNFTGSVWVALQTLALEVGGTDVFIQHGVVNMITQNDVVGLNNLAVLDSTTGLLDVPKIIVPNIVCTMIFEPNVTLGTLINLKSTYNPTASGPCKIVGYKHSGVISAVQSGNLTTELTLQYTKSAVGQ